MEMKHMHTLLPRAFFISRVCACAPTILVDCDVAALADIASGSRFRLSLVGFARRSIGIALAQHTQDAMMVNAAITATEHIAGRDEACIAAMALFLKI